MRGRIEFVCHKIDREMAQRELDVLGVSSVDPLAQFRDGDGELVESDEFFEWAHRASVLRVLSGQ